MKPALKKALWLAVRVLVSAACIAYVLWKVDFRDRVDVLDTAGQPVEVYGWITDRTPDSVTLRQAHGPTSTFPLDRVAHDPRTGEPVIVDGFLHVFRDVFSEGGWPWFIAAVFAYVLSPFFGAWRWQILLRIQQIRLTFGQSLRLTWIGFFFNTFMPGVTGGDIVKAYYAARQTHLKAEAVATVFLDRLLGMLGMALLCIVGLALRWTDPAIGEARWFIVGFLVFSALAAVIFYSRRVRRWIALDRLIARLPARRLVKRLDEAVFIYRHHRRIVLLAILQSWGAHMVSIASVYFGARALGLDPDFRYFLVYMPVIWIAAAIVPSVGGLGFMESLSQRFFTAAILGLAATEQMSAASYALSIMLLFRASMFVAVLPGGLLNILHPQVSVKEAEREMQVVEQTDA